MMFRQDCHSRRWVLALAAWFAAPSASAGEPLWVEAERLSPFVYRADFHLDERESLLGELRQLQRDLSESLALEASDEPIELYLFRDEKSYREYLTARFGDLPARRALYIKTTTGPGMVYAFRGPQFAIDLRHESTHALVHGALTEIPLWLDEGLAEYFEMPAEQRQAGHPHLPGILARLRAGELPRLETLERLDDTTGLSREDYAAAWAWVHFLHHGPPGAHGELVSYLREVQQPSVQPVPLSTRLRRLLPQLERTFAEHLARHAPR